MKAEIIAVGTELLLGQIANTNAQFLSGKLADLGVDVYYQTVVGDNIARIRSALDIAAGRADCIIMTGGLGPTQDDLTRDAVAEQLGRKLAVDEPSLSKIRGFFDARGIPMVESNARQALYIEGGDALPNEAGMAVGSAVEQDGKLYVLLPGPPREMKPMFERFAAAWIRQRSGVVEPLHSVMLKFAGIGESLLEHRLLDLIEGQSDVTIAPYAKEGEVTIRLTTRASTEREAMERMKPIQAEIQSRVGKHLYAEDDASIEQAVVRLLTDAGQTAATAESCTGGLIGDMLTSVPGSSAAYKGGIVCYTNDIKKRWVEVPAELLEGDGAPGAVSRETAECLAANVRRLAGADYGIGVTGIAGPSSVEGKPVGLVYIAIAGPDGTCVCREANYAYSGNREAVKLRAARNALYMLWSRLTGQLEEE